MEKRGDFNGTEKTTKPVEGGSQVAKKNLSKQYSILTLVLFGI